MIKTFCFRAALAASLWLLVAGCSTASSGRSSQKFFHDSETVSVVLHFYRWDSIYMTRPDTRQAGFLPVLTRDQVSRELRHRAMRRDAAVVVVGYTYSDDQMTSLVRDWKQLLNAQGFRRVVLLRAGAGKQIDGLPVIEDSGISFGHDAPGHTATFAALPLPSAAGADVAHSSGPAIW